MNEDPALSPAAFGKAFRAFLEEAAKGHETEDPPFVERLASHLGADPCGLPILATATPTRPSTSSSSRAARSPCAYSAASRGDRVA